MICFILFFLPTRRFLHNKKLTYYKGNFNTFEKVRAEQLRCDWKAYEKQQKEKKENQEFIERFRANVKQAAMVCVVDALSTCL